MKVNVHYKDINASHILGAKLKEIIHENDGQIILVCIGSDRVIYDSLGPLVGTLLLDIGIEVPIFGPLNSPIHSENIKIEIEEIKEKFPNHKLVVIDGAFGEESDVGFIVVKRGSIKPGLGVDKNISAVGDYSIVPIIGNYEISKYISKLPIRLRNIFEIAVVIREAFKYAYSCCDI
ncbi:spore protease YyaC [Clostridium saccharobutylicum]|nr:spore protease YyaC [Clostridium saccharobutylicum]